MPGRPFDLELAEVGPPPPDAADNGGARVFDPVVRAGQRLDETGQLNRLRASVRSGARFREPALGYRYPISWALANASVRFRAPSLTMADDR